MVHLPLEVEMYFEILLWLGVSGALFSLVGTESWSLLSCAAAVAVGYWFQRSLLKRFSEDGAHRVFVLAIITQFVAGVVAATVTPYVGVRIILAGMALNVLVISVNDWRMPCPGVSGSNECYTETNERTRLPWLGDIFRTTETTWCWPAVSVGDAVDLVGIWVLTAELLLVAWLP